MFGAEGVPDPCQGLDSSSMEANISLPDLRSGKVFVAARATSSKAFYRRAQVLDQPFDELRPFFGAARTRAGLRLGSASSRGRLGLIDGLYDAIRTLCGALSTPLAG